MTTGIRFVVDSINSRADIYGNRYWSARVVSTKTGRAVWILNYGGQGNAEYLVRQLTGQNYPAIFTTHEEVAIRKYNAVYRDLEARRKEHGPEAGYYYEHELTADILAALEKDGE